MSRNQWERAHRYDDFLKEDHRRECVHGNVKQCPQCDAEAEEYLALERWLAFEVRATWFIYGVAFVMVLVMLRELWIAP